MLVVLAANITAMIMSFQPLIGVKGGGFIVQYYDIRLPSTLFVFVVDHARSGNDLANERDHAQESGRYGGVRYSEG